ncbi:AraC family transcriptional regulator [Kordia periserrulae]|uniref:AraC family transcriptional regulator n=1 Tax=Kordia periserrulae TaxID=701523 RepID=A0A2T6BUE9_9FLAO|nr:AraC family transcriptional regulator [Kordia periserrulae]PTX59710.1 AraC family transcriptional regulator [Kordia periserrulae]
MFLFPNFNIHSTPLLILVLQALVLVGLLLKRYAAKKNASDAILAILLLTVSYTQICYTVGFMGWYDTFRNTKINYFLIPAGTAIAPLIYLYVKSVTKSNFKFLKKHWWHFAIPLSLVAYRFSIFTYDALQPGFNETQNGILKIELDEPIILPILSVVGFSVMLLYLAFTIQLYVNYRQKIKQYFSNIFKLELNWIRNFLIVFTLLFIYSSVQDFVGSILVDLGYKERWWLNLLMAVCALYIGLKGYITDTTKLNTLDFSFSPKQISIPELTKDDKKEIDKDAIQAISELMAQEKPYLNPDLNLSELAKQANLTRGQLSEIINSGFQMNFNDFVNSYRVNAFKGMLKEGKHEQLSLLGIAYECGFNSKATFNRVFKKLTNFSPTQYLQSQSG